MQIPSDLVFGVRVAAPQPRVFSGKDPQVAAAPYEAIGQIGETIQKIGIQFEERAADLEKARKFTELSTELTKSRADLDVRMLDHRDHETYMTTWESEWKKIQEPILKAARVDPFVYKAMNVEASRAYASEYSTQVTRQRQMMVDKFGAVEDDATYTTLNSIKTVQQAESAYTFLNVLNDANYNRKGASKHSKRAREIPQMVAEALVTNTRMVSSQQASDMLDDPNSLVSRMLPEAKRLALHKDVESERRTEEAYQEKKRDDRMKIKEQYLEDGIRNGTIGVRELNIWRDQGDAFRPEKYDHFRLQIQNYEKGDFDDAGVTGGIESDLYDPSKTQSVTLDRIRTLEKNGEITAKSAGRLKKLVRDVRESESRLPDGFTQGMSTIKEHIAPSMLTFNPRADEVAMYTPLAREYREWVMRNLSSTASEQINKAYEIIDRWKAKKPAVKQGKVNPYVPSDNTSTAKEESLKRLAADYKKDKGKWQLHTQSEYNAWRIQLESGGN